MSLYITVSDTPTTVQPGDKYVFRSPISVTEEAYGDLRYYEELEETIRRCIPKLQELFFEQIKLHVQKDGDYAQPGVPFQNLKEATELGLTPVDAALVRAGDKWRRTTNLHKREKLGGLPRNES